MFRVKRARSVIHSLAHHGVSALSWLHPKLGEESKEQKIVEVTYDFCNSQVITEGFKSSNETKNAFAALQQTFERIASGEKIYLSQLNSASITFGFKQGRWPNYCICCLTSKNGNSIQVKTDGYGKKLDLLSNFKNYS